MLRAYLTLILLLTLSFSTWANDIVVVVNKDNDTASLTKRQLIDIYMGRYQTFPNGQKANPVDMPAQSQLKHAFYMQLVNQSESKISAYWAKLLFSGRAKPPEVAEDVQEVLQKLQDSSDAMAYIPASELTDEIKVVYRLNEN